MIFTLMDFLAYWQNRFSFKLQLKYFTATNNQRKKERKRERTNVRVREKAERAGLRRSLHNLQAQLISIAILAYEIESHAGFISIIHGALLLLLLLLFCSVWIISFAQQRGDETVRQSDRDSDKARRCCCCLK